MKDDICQMLTYEDARKLIKMYEKAKQYINNGGLIKNDVKYWDELKKAIEELEAE